MSSDGFEASHLTMRCKQTARDLGKQWPVAHLTVQAVSPEKWQLDLLTRLPLGISLHNHITCVPLDDHHTRVSFG